MHRLSVDKRVNEKPQKIKKQASDFYAAIKLWTRKYQDETQSSDRLHNFCMNSVNTTGVQIYTNHILD